MPLTDTKIRGAKPSVKLQKLTDSHGLYLEVRPSGAKLWRYRYRIAGKENLYALGEYCQPPSGESVDGAKERRKSGRFTLSEARQERDRCRGLVKQRIHPSHARRAKRRTQAAKDANTFEAVAREWVEEQMTKGLWAPKHRRRVIRSLEQDVFPVIGALPISEITPPQFLEILQKIDKRGAPTMSISARQWSSNIFQHAMATLRATGDPTVVLKGAVQRPKVKHHTPLPREEIPRFCRALDAYPGYPTTVIALKLLLLTFVRPGELRQAKWHELDLDGKVWRIPAQRMKMGEEHLVPLSGQAIELLEELQCLTGRQQWLFPNQRRPQDCMAIPTLNRALYYLGFSGPGTIGFSPHGFRATASTILNEFNYRADAIERQLAHKERDQSRASYNHAEYLKERTEMMQWWADYVDGLRSGANVVQLHQRA